MKLNGNFNTKCHSPAYLSLAQKGLWVFDFYFWQYFVVPLLNIWKIKFEKQPLKVFWFRLDFFRLYLQKWQKVRHKEMKFFHNNEVTICCSNIIGRWKSKGNKKYKKTHLFSPPYSFSLLPLIPLPPSLSPSLSLYFIGLSLSLSLFCWEILTWLRKAFYSLEFLPFIFSPFLSRLISSPL